MKRYVLILKRSWGPPLDELFLDVPVPIETMLFPPDLADGARKWMLSLIDSPHKQATELHALGDTGVYLTFLDVAHRCERRGWQFRPPRIVNVDTWFEEARDE